jgi:hypothetical protein
MKPLTQEWVEYFRYPGDTATLAESQMALKNCKGIRREVRLSLGLPV